MLVTVSSSASYIPMVVNGRLAKVGEFPAALVILAESGTVECSATRIARKQILTAAHCVYRRNKVDKDEPGKHYESYAAGRALLIHTAVELNDREDPKHRFTAIIKSARVHPDYLKTRAEKEHAPDLALIEFENDLPEHLQIAKLDFRPLQLETEAVFAGFGDTKVTVDSLLSPGSRLIQWMGIRSPVVPATESKPIPHVAGLHTAVAQVKACADGFLEFRGPDIVGLSRTQLPMLGPGDSGGALYLPEAPAHLTVVGVNSYVNTLTQSSYVTALEGAEAQAWIKSILGSEISQVGVTPLKD